MRLFLFFVTLLGKLVIGTTVDAGILHQHPDFLSDRQPDDNTSSSNDSEEEQFQVYLDNLFDTKGKTIDTSGWCTHRINCARFDYRLLCDTLKIPLIDTLQKRKFTYPLKNYVTSPFGPRHRFWHFGTDIKVMYRDTIRCMSDGIVRIITNDRNGYGKVVVVRHHYGLETLYAHLAVTLVKDKQALKSGDVIGLGGRTGRATGNHLHFEIRFCGEPFDPAYVLDYDNLTCRGDTLCISRSTFEYVSDLRKTVYYIIRKGDNLGKIARIHGTSITTLCRINGITSTTLLRIGSRLVIRREKPEELILRKTSIHDGKES